MSKLARACQIGVLFSLGSYFSMKSSSQIQWQLWSVAIIFLHMVLWNKRGMVEKSDFDEYELKIWDQWFSELDEFEFKKMMKFSQWEEFTRSGFMNIENNQFILIWNESPIWREYHLGEKLSFEKNSLFFTMDANLMQDEASLFHLKVSKIILDQNSLRSAA